MSKRNLTELKNFLEEYLELKGINTKKFMRCFSLEHEDKNPSMNYFAPGKICKCFACGAKYDIFKLVGQEYNLTNFHDQVEKVYELYTNKELIKNANETIYSRKGTNINLETSDKTLKENTTNSLENMSVEFLRKYRLYIEKCQNNLSQTDYLTNRGISKELQKKRGIGYDSEFKNGEWKALIIPTWYGSFTARNTDKNSNDRLRKVGRMEIYNYWQLQENPKKNFYIVEGEIDALSLEEVGKNAIALGSIASINLLIKRFQNDKPTNTFYLMLDNDEQGIKAQEELYNKMKGLGLKVEKTNLLGKYKDPNDYLVEDRNSFTKTLNRFETIKNFSNENNEKNKRVIPKKSIIKDISYER